MALWGSGVRIPSAPPSGERGRSEENPGKLISLRSECSEAAMVASGLATTGEIKSHAAASYANFAAVLGKKI